MEIGLRRTLVGCYWKYGFDPSWMKHTTPHALHLSLIEPTNLTDKYIYISMALELDMSHAQPE